MSDGRCARCDAEFRCGRDEADACWCTTLPTLPARLLQPDAGCLCPRCLAQALETAGSCGASTGAAAPVHLRPPAG